MSFAKEKICNLDYDKLFGITWSLAMKHSPINWYDYREDLRQECEIIVASAMSFYLADVMNVREFSNLVARKLYFLWKKMGYRKVRVGRRVSWRSPIISQYEG